jgi:hypothetical protein
MLPASLARAVVFACWERSTIPAVACPIMALSSAVVAPVMSPSDAALCRMSWKVRSSRWVILRAADTRTQRLGVAACRERVRAFVAIPIGAVVAGSERGAAALNAAKGPSRLSHLDLQEART